MSDAQNTAPENNAPTGPSTVVIYVHPRQLKAATWNYKQPGTEQRRKKLRNSIAHDGSAGVLAVREIPAEEGDPLTTEDGLTIYEAVDGNHRLEPVLAMNWQSIPVENFGPISKAEAILIARRRNANWFEDDVVALGELLKNDVIGDGQYQVSELAEFMPDSEEELRATLDLVQAHTWQDPQQDETKPKKDNDGLRTVTLKMSDAAFLIFEQAVEKVSARLQEDGHKLHEDKEIAYGQTIELLAAEYLAGP
jgi:hypothetical protein